MDVQYLERTRAPTIAYAVHEPAEKPRAAVLLTHGYAEHMGRYDAVLRGWTERGLLVVTYDLRGHGRSEGPRGHVDRFDEYVQDATDLLAALSRTERFRALSPPVLFGHSLGGLISSHVALTRPGGYRGLAMTSPFYGLAARVPRVRLIAGRAMSKIFPRLRQPSGLKGADLTHDVQLSESYDSDPYHFGHVTVRWFTEVASAQHRLAENASKLTLPMFCLAAGADRVVSTETARKVFASVGSRDKEIVVLSGLYHEVLNEIDRDQHIRTLADRILRWST